MNVPGALLLASLVAAPPATIATAPSFGDALPAQFLHDQVWVTPRVDGRTLRLFTDTGGGWNALGADNADALGLAVDEISGDGGTVRLVDFPRFDEGHSIPSPPPYFMGGRLMLAPSDQFDGDGFLGGRWFADGVWSFDYRAGTLRRLATAADVRGAAVPLGFQTDADGRRTMHFPSMTIVVDGEELDVLLDTGATATLTATSGPVFGLLPDTDVGTSFIEHAVFERWTLAHPEWRVLEHADRKGEQLRRMIEVPRITVAGHDVGPVWFAEQPDGAFQRYMAGMMDRPTWGALGGSGLRYFRVVIDYPGAQAWFEPLTVPAE